jgi:zinc protease
MTLVHRHPFGAGLAIEKHQLSNGLVVLLLRDPAAPVVAYQTWYRVGSSHERPGKTGLAHLFEHLMFNQTANLAAGEFDRRMEAVGGETNAATWVDWTYYRDSVPAAQLELAITLEADRMAHLTLTEKQLESEREVVASERRMRVDDDVEGFLSEELFRHVFTTHPYHWPTIGWMDDIMGFTTTDCRDFYATYYAPNNATLVICGDLDVDATLALVEKHYGKIPAAKLPGATLGVEPPQAVERRASWKKPVPADRAVFAWRAPAQGHPDWLPLQLASEVLLGGPSSRLYRRLVVESETASSVSGMLMPVAQPGLFEIFTSMVRGKTAADAEAIIDEEIERLIRDSLSPAELAKCKNRYETGFWSELETADGKAEALGHYETVLGDYRGLFTAAARVETLTVEDVRSAAATYLKKEARTIVIAEPSGEDDDEDDDGDDAAGSEGTEAHE